MTGFWFKPLLSVSIIVLAHFRAWRLRVHEVCTTIAVPVYTAGRAMESNCDGIHPDTVMHQTLSRRERAAAHA
jgi:hypothetical protein